MTPDVNERAGVEAVGRATALAQGAFWLATGLWPLVHYRSFEAVTGPKRDDWLVKTIGGLIACVGGALLLGGRRERVSAETALLGASSAATLALADVYFVATGRISRIYLLDVLAELPFLGGWVSLGLSRRDAIPSSKVQEEPQPSADQGLRLLH